MTNGCNLYFEGECPDAAKLGAQWHAALSEAESVIALLPPNAVGECVLAHDRRLFRGNAVELAVALDKGALSFHAGSIGVSWPHAINTYGSF